ncbi:hypothetical protein JW926_16065 [Candidatus Sumerlaeota bacterium]|nr:hypothetical protein [Candidatus Sumerlaeota bacterium]
MSAIGFSIARLFLLSVFFLVPFLLGYLVCRLALKLSVFASLALSLLFTIVGIMYILLPNFLSNRPPQWTFPLLHIPGRSIDSAIYLFPKAYLLLIVFVFIIAGGAFLLKIVRKWQGTGLTEGEKKPGLPGFKAWLCASNLLWGVAIAVCGFLLGFGFYNVFVAILIMLAIYPALKTLSGQESGAPKPESGETVPKSSSEESAQILKMLEAGKITSEEATDLLNALSQRERPKQNGLVKLSIFRKLILFGAAFVLLGFFLPWFKINVGKEMNRLNNKLLSEMIPKDIPLPKQDIDLGEDLIVSLKGADIKDGLGWLILLLSLGIAVLPYLNLKMDRQTFQTVSLLAVGLGSLILLHLFFSSFRFMSIGLLIVIAGYVLQISGLIKEKTSGGYSI